VEKVNWRQQTVKESAMNRPTRLLSIAARICILSAATLVVSGCGGGKVANPDDELSLKEIMLNRVDQSADLLWEAVSTKSDATGVHVKQPQTAAEWGKLEEAAATIMTSMDLFLVKDRPLVPKGAEVADAEVPGAQNAKTIAAIIAADRPGFDRHAMKLKAVAVRMRDAARTRNPNALMELGGELDDACEECHKQFWYPPK
jgi:cytochrome c556